MADAQHAARVMTGIEGLDEILGGGLPEGFPYLLQGEPGAGKTTVALHFAFDGERRGEKVLYITLSQTRRELYASIAGHGWPEPRFEIYELAADAQLSSADAHQTLFHPGDVELEELTAAIIRRVEASDARRVVIDSLAEIRMLAGDAVQFRRQILALQQNLQTRDATVLMLDEPSTQQAGYEVEGLMHGVIILYQRPPEYGRDHRQVRIQKLRSGEISEGYHDIRLREGGLVVFPRLITANGMREAPTGHITSGVPEMDALLGGGLAVGTCHLFLGPAGVGKSTLATQYACNLARSGKRTAMWVFDESRHTYFSRSASLGLPLPQAVEDGTILFRQVDPAELSPGEFLCDLRRAVEEDGIELVVLDSLNGFMAGMPGERNLTIHLHELVAYLNDKGVASILVFGQPGLFAPFSSSPPYDITYLADSILLARYYEYGGEVRKALSVFKKRADKHETTIRDLELREGGISVGEPLRQFRGVLSGLPELANSNDGADHTARRPARKETGGDPHGGNP